MRPAVHVLVLWASITGGGDARADVPNLPPADQKLHDPLAESAKADDSYGRVIAALNDYDVAALIELAATLEKRAASDSAKPDDDYFFAQAKLGLLQIDRFYETDLPNQVPARLDEVELERDAGIAMTAALRYATAHPDHSDIQRVIAELWSAQIRGMTGGMTLGPKAREAIEASLAKDARNALAWLGQARMHYHNPSFVGGDKDLALVEFRRISEDTGHLRACLYMARIYRDREMYTQARFFAKKALRLAPGNPEAKLLHDDATAKGEAKEAGR